MGVYPPNHPFVHRVFHYKYIFTIHFGVSPYFWFNILSWTFFTKGTKNGTPARFRSRTLAFSKASFKSSCPGGFNLREPPQIPGKSCHLVAPRYPKISLPLPNQDFLIRVDTKIQEIHHCYPFFPKKIAFLAENIFYTC